MKKKIKNNKNYSKYFVIVCAISIASILISNITAVKIFSVGGIILPTSALLFPITYILGDVIAEVYGYKNAKLVIVLGFLCNAFMVLFFMIAIWLPASPTWGNQQAFQTILGTTPRMFIASLMAFLLGSLSNAYILNIIKKFTNGNKLWMRTIGSTIVGEALDTIIFANIAFWGTIPFNVLLSMIVCQYLWKVGYEILATPLTYFVIGKYKKLENNN